MSDARSLFDTVIVDYPSMSLYLSADAAFVHSVKFESGKFELISHRENY